MKPCIECGVVSSGTRCHTCQRKRNKQIESRRPNRDDRYPAWERKRMRAVVAKHRATFGAWCPGFKRPAHVASDLTADHLTPIKYGGLGGALVVLCRSCNSTKGSR